MAKRRIAVIGAGLSGLAAAYRLQQAGAEVEVFEAGTVAGGRVPMVHKNGYIFDTGADALTDGYTEYLALLRTIGLEDRLVPITSKLGTLKNGRIVAMDAASRLSMAFTPLLSWRAKLKLLRGIKKLAPMLADIDPGRLHLKSVYDSETESARDFCLRHFGAELTDYLFDPMIRTLNGSGVASASIVDILGGLSLAGGATYCLRGGQAVFPQELAKRVPVRYGAKVESVSEEGDKVVVGFAADGASQRLTVDGCVLATTYDAASAMSPKLAALSAEYRAALTHIKLIKVQLGYRVRTTSEAYVIQSPTVEDDEVMLVFLDHNKCADRAPPGHSLVTVYCETNATPRYLPKSDADLVAWARAKAEPLFPELAGHFDVAQVTRWPAMAHANVPGFYKQAAQLLNRLDDTDRIQIAGDLFAKTSQEAAVAWGNRAADNLIKQGQH